MRIVRALASLAALWPLSVTAADDVVLYAQDIPASEFVGVLYREVLQRPFVVSPAVQASRSLVSVHFKGSRQQAVQDALKYLQGMGFNIRSEGGVDRIEIVQVEKPVEKKEPRVSLFYQPRYRDSSDLASAIRSLFPEARLSIQGNSTDLNLSSSKNGNSTSASPVLAVIAPESEIPQLRRVLPRLDTQSEDLLIKAAVFEVGLNAETGSAFSVALNVLSKAASEMRDFGGVFRSMSSGGSSNTAITGSQLIGAGAVSSFNLGAASVEAVISSLSSDGRFSLLTSPAVRARSGVPTALSVGQSVPVLGSVAFNRDAGPVQSVEYRDAGVIFTVRPVVVQSNINLDVHQEISDFVRTTTGVNNSPTLTKRSLTGSLSTRDGEVVLLGGLSQRKEAEGFQGLALNYGLGGSTSSVMRSDLLVVLQVSVVPRAAAPRSVPSKAPKPSPAPTQRPPRAATLPQEPVYK